MSDEIRLIKTEDGSHSLYHSGLNETYHSTHGAVTESQHVFINAGLDHFSKMHTSGEIRVLEVGFGTGLNALLAYCYALESQRIVEYTTLEPFPLGENLYSELNFHEIVNQHQTKELLYQLHSCDWHQQIRLNLVFNFKKLQTKLEDFESRPEEFDVVFYDAFAPSKQLELWDRDLLEKVVGFLAPEGVLVTYCARGQFKRDLASLGMEVETLPGPPGKKEMVRAVKNG